MNSLTKTKINLPANIEELTKFVLIGREKLVSVRAFIRAIDKLGLAKDVREQKKDEAQQLAGALLDAESKIGELLKNIKTKPITDSATGRTIGSEKSLPTGISKKQSHFFQTLASNPEIVEQVKAEAIENDDLPTRTEVLRKVKEKDKTERIKKESESRTDSIKGIDLRIGDFKDVLSGVHNIDAIITDPPYPKEFIECFSDLSKYASEHLKDDGFCAIYSGQYNLPEVIQRLSEHLTYVWTFCLYHVGKKQLVNGVNIMCGWKPVLIFSKGRKKMRFSAYDVLISEAMEKHSHKWQQSESGVMSLVEIFSGPGETIVDPFAGSGTFLKVASEMGRKAIGAEIDKAKE